MDEDDEPVIEGATLPFNWPGNTPAEWKDYYQNREIPDRYKEVKCEECGHKVVSGNISIHKDEHYSRCQANIWLAQAKEDGFEIVQDVEMLRLLTQAGRTDQILRRPGHLKRVMSEELFVRKDFIKAYWNDIFNALKSIVDLGALVHHTPYVPPIKLNEAYQQREIFTEMFKKAIEDEEYAEYLILQGDLKKERR